MTTFSKFRCTVVCLLPNRLCGLCVASRRLTTASRVRSMVSSVLVMEKRTPQLTRCAPKRSRHSCAESPYSRRGCVRPNTQAKRTQTTMAASRGGHCSRHSLVCQSCSWPWACRRDDLKFQVVRQAYLRHMPRTSIFGDSVLSCSSRPESGSVLCASNQHSIATRSYV